MPSAVVILLSALLLPAAPPVRTVLLTDAETPSFELSLVRHMLIQNLAGDASVHLLTDLAPSPGEGRAAKLRRRGKKQLVRALEQLEALAPETALAQAAKARENLQRVAILTGDTTELGQALALLVSSLLLLGSEQAAQPILHELLNLQPDWQGHAAWFNPNMQRAVALARAAYAGSDRRPLRIRATDPQAALFVDGTLVGFGAAETSVLAAGAHFVWGLAPDGQHVALRLPPKASEPGHQQAFAAPMSLTLAFDKHPPAAQLPKERFAAAMATSRSSSLDVQVATPVLAAMNVQRVLVLADRAGEIVLTHLRLEPAERRRARVPAYVSTVGEAQAAALQLLRAPPKLVVPLPGREPGR